MAADAVTKAIEIADIQWKNVDVTKLIIYVALTSSAEVIKKHGLTNLIPIQQPRTTVRSRIALRGRGKETPG